MIPGAGVDVHGNPFGSNFNDPASSSGHSSGNDNSPEFDHSTGMGMHSDF